MPPIDMGKFVMTVKINESNKLSELSSITRFFRALLVSLWIIEYLRFGTKWQIEPKVNNLEELKIVFTLRIAQIFTLYIFTLNFNKI